MIVLTKKYDSGIIRLDSEHTRGTLYELQVRADAQNHILES